MKDQEQDLGKTEQSQQQVQEPTTHALIPRGAYLTLGDLFALEWPHLSDEDKDFALYEFTGFPCFWETDNPIAELRQQMRDFRNGATNYHLPIDA